MHPSPYMRVYALDDPEEVDVLSAMLRDWEPCIELYKPPRGSFLYEPDGTLYAIVLRDGMTLTKNRREVKVGTGDLIVLPQGHGVDAGDDIDLIAFRHEGSPPDHFRERFIQVWGFDHLPAPSSTEEEGGYSEIVSPGDVRFRFPYAVLDVKPAKAHVVNASEDFRLLIAFEGKITVVSGIEGERTLFLQSRQATVIAPGNAFRVGGAGRMGMLTVSSELAHEARRNDAAPILKGPEYRSESAKG